MADMRGKQDSKELSAMRWSPMVVVSLLFHFAIFSVILFVPESFPTKRIDGVVYEVNLVEMPGGKDLKTRRTGLPKEGKGKPVSKSSARAKRIKVVPKKKKPLVIAKRTIKKKGPPINKKKISSSKKMSSSQLIDKAISKIEKKVQTEKKDHLTQAFSRLETNVKGQSGSGSGGRPGVLGTIMQIYQMEVEEWVKGNWAYPVALEGEKELEATVLLMVRRDGRITKSEFLSRSSNTIFDQSVSRAIKRSDPLPPFPEGYRKSHDEIEITFNLKELESR